MRRILILLQLVFDPSMPTLSKLKGPSDCFACRPCAFSVSMLLQKGLEIRPVRNPKLTQFLQIFFDLSAGPPEPILARIEVKPSPSNCLGLLLTLPLLRGSFNNYVDHILPNFDHLPLSNGQLWTFYPIPTLCSHEQAWTFY